MTLTGKTEGRRVISLVLRRQRLTTHGRNFSSFHCEAEYSNVLAFHERVQKHDGFLDSASRRVLAAYEAS